MRMLRFVRPQRSQRRQKRGQTIPHVENGAGSAFPRRHLAPHAGAPCGFHDETAKVVFKKIYLPTRRPTG